MARRYCALSIAEGLGFMKHVQNIFLKPIKEDSYFVEPWENRGVREASFFRYTRDNFCPLEIFFLATGEELANADIDSDPTVFVYGACNYVRVIQMRAQGELVLQEDIPGYRKIKFFLRGKIEKKIKQLSVSGNLFELDQKVFNEALLMVKHSQLVCFRPCAYAYLN